MWELSIQPPYYNQFYLKIIFTIVFLFVSIKPIYFIYDRELVL